jgi:glycosyltransferase involved in cell wall biosynthesis
VPEAHVEVFNWILDPLGTDIPFANRHGVMFLGGYRHKPNIDAVHYFLDSIWPLVEARLDGAKFFVVGSHLPDELAERASDRVIMVGFVEDLRPFMDQCRLSVVPLRYGAGTKGKLAMSLAYGLPAVSTSVGAEGMGLRDGDCVYISDDPQVFADHIVSMHEDEANWVRMSERSLGYVTENLSRAAGIEIIRRALNAEIN